MITIALEERMDVRGDANLMRRWTNIFLVLLLLNGCRRNAVTTDGNSQPVDPPPSASFEQSLSFSWTGTNQFRRYSKIQAHYSDASGLTTIETFDDSTTLGKVFVQIRGNRASMYRYNVTGSPQDTNQVYIKFIPAFTGSSPSAHFELTGIPADSLEAEVEISHFGAARDSIVGTIAATLKATSINARILLYDGRFKAQRL